MDFGFPQQYPINSPYLSTPCTNLVPPILEGASILTLTATEVHNFSYPPTPISPIAHSNLEFCNITVTLAHPGANDTVYITIWLPLSPSWNGRYQATGGGGLAAQIGEPMLVSSLAAGYATSSTDAGLTLNNTIDPQSGIWALLPSGGPNEELQLNFAWRSVHDMVVVSKDLIKQFYGTEARYAYYHGCSQGGRQGYAAAAKYPEDFDGVLAIAPAISIVSFAPADFWPIVVMQNAEGGVPPFCIFEAYQKAIIEACDPLDGVVDGLISDHELLETCPFDPTSLVGTEIQCTKGDPLTITPSHASIVSKILEGPLAPSGERLWYGIAPGASFFAVSRTVLTNGTWTLQPFDAAQNWLKYLALQDPDFDMSTMTYAQFYAGFQDSVSKLSPLWGDHQLNLTSFRDAGGKLLTWYGLADDYIPPSGTLRYRDSVEETFGGAEKADEFYRLFLVPGAGHCWSGYGPKPNDPLGALVRWVEEGRAPEVLPAKHVGEDGAEVTRDLCRYPKKLVYQGGDVNLASSFECA
ncbi:feruloyl esterase [Stipitochalara longipes BDJ]|nr:feruloyl esterase [Stipitochalara longipes BDJ]